MYLLRQKLFHQVFGDFLSVNCFFKTVGGAAGTRSIVSSMEEVLSRLAISPRTASNNFEINSYIRVFATQANRSSLDRD